MRAITRIVCVALLALMLGCECKCKDEGWSLDHDLSKKNPTPQQLKDLEERYRITSMNDLKIIAVSEMEFINKNGVYGTLEELNSDIEELKASKMRSPGWSFEIILSPDRKSFCTVAKPSKGDWLYGNADAEVKSLPPFEVDPKTCKIKD